MFAPASVCAGGSAWQAASGPGQMTRAVADRGASDAQRPPKRALFLSVGHDGGASGAGHRSRTAATIGSIHPGASLPATLRASRRPRVAPGKGRRG
jgi:hypothetical protein